MINANHGLLQQMIFAIKKINKTKVSKLVRQTNLSNQNRLSSIFRKLFLYNRCVEHGRTETIAKRFPPQRLIINTTPATIPEFLFGGDLIKSDGLESQPRIHFNNRQTGCNTEYLSLWITGARQLKGLILDRFGDTAFPIFRETIKPEFETKVRFSQVWM